MKVNVQEAKTHLSRYLELARQGQAILVCHRNVPVAELRGVPAAATKRRIFGMHKDSVSGLRECFGAWGERG